MNRVYLDWAATSPPDPDILEAMTGIARTAGGNPSSVHEEGRIAKASLESSRSSLAALAGAEPGRIAFTGSGTEADSIPLLALLPRKSPVALVLSGIEHAAVHEQALLLGRMGADVRIVKPGNDGIVEPEAILDEIAKARDRGTFVLSCLMAVNNETGAIQKTRALSDALRELPGKRVCLHCDAVQAFGKTAFDLSALGADTVALSAHKLQGPKGVGALVAFTPLEVLSRGGGQEQGLRAGTENVAGAFALAMAAGKAFAERESRSELAVALCARLIEGLSSIPGVRILPECRELRDPKYSPWILSAAFPGLGGETLVRLLDDAGIAVSTGSACSASRKERRVLDAMGVARELSFSAIRISSGPRSTAEDIDRFLDKAETLYHGYRAP